MCREVSSLGGVSSHPEGHGVWGGGGGGPMRGVLLGVGWANMLCKKCYELCSAGWWRYDDTVRCVLSIQQGQRT